MNERQSMEVDIACVGFGPAMGGFLSTLSPKLVNEQGQPRFESKAMPGMPLQVICYERADDLAFGVSGVVSSAKGLKKSFPELDFSLIPMTSPVTGEKIVYLQDPVGASRRPGWLKLSDKILNVFKFLPGIKEHAYELPYTPPFLRKDEGYVMAVGQFNQWVSAQVQASGLVQIWPAMPVAKALIENESVTGIQLVDQGVSLSGEPDANYMPGMNIKAPLTVIADGPVGAISQQLDQHFGFPEGHHQRDWAVGMKAVVELPSDCKLKPGTVLHTIGYPEPEIFGFLYVLPDGLASLGIFIPSWFDTPVRNAYRYLQHWMQHPYLWQYLKGGTLRSWGAKSLQESGKRGEPYLVGNGYARIGESSGSTNVLTNSGVDEAWITGVQLAEGVLELLENGKDYTKENLERSYVKRRRSSEMERELEVARNARDGFQKSFFLGMAGTALSGLTGGKLNLKFEPKRPYERVPGFEEYYKDVLSEDELKRLKEACRKANQPLHDKLMEACGWPAIKYDNKLLLSHQDALMLGGKVQAAPGYADHVGFIDAKLCQSCGSQICIECCSGQALMPAEDGGTPQFDREKCIHCGACLWNCSKASPENPEKTNIIFKAGSGGLHSAEN